MRDLILAFALAIVLTIAFKPVFAASDTATLNVTERAYVTVYEGNPPRTVPEPETLWLLAVAGGAAWLLKRRK